MGLLRRCSGYLFPLPEKRACLACLGADSKDEI